MLVIFRHGDGPEVGMRAQCEVTAAAAVQQDEWGTAERRDICWRGMGSIPYRMGSETDRWAGKGSLSYLARMEVISLFGSLIERSVSHGQH